MKRGGSQGVGDFKRRRMYEMMTNVVLSYDYWLLDSRQLSLLVRSHQAPSFLCYLALPTIYKYCWNDFCDAFITSFLIKQYVGRQV